MSLARIFSCQIINTEFDNLTNCNFVDIYEIEARTQANMDTTFLEARIAAAKARIELWESAITQIATGAVQSFSLDTGQTRQVITMANITEARKAMTAEYSLLYQLEARLYGGSITARPGY